MFKKITRELHGLRMEAHAVGASLAAIRDALQALDRGEGEAQRLSELEGQLAAFQGQIDAGITRADALKGTALAAEDRARSHAKRAEAALELAQSVEGGEDEDSFEAVGRAYAGVVPDGNGAVSPDEAVPSLPNSMAERRASRASARASKRR